MAAYYNEIDPFAAQWLRRLIARGLIADGVVDERSIAEVQPDELEGFTQCHFFAGIGGWSLAARLAGWPDDRELWTGSCPCQPFSVIGKRGGESDERHLWPEFRRLIEARRPAVVAGEQVAGKDGRSWLAGVHASLETLGYRFGAADLCAAGIGAPHIRQRLWWVADTDGGQSWRQRKVQHGRKYGIGSQNRISVDRPRDERSDKGGMGNAERTGLEGHAGDVDNRQEPGRQQTNASGSTAAPGGHRWSGIWIPCADGKARRIKPGLEPLAHGVPRRMDMLRGYGNAIVPDLAAEFLMAYWEVA